jgi:UDP-N-acetylmuramoyl-tripeptide--D-alanyl-D-alanine ligase
MGERKPGDLEHLCRIARPDIGVVTNVGLAHAEFLGGPEGVFGALAEMLQALPATGTAVLNADDPFLGRLTDATEARVLRAGTAADAEYRLEGVELDAQLRPTFRMLDHLFTVPLRGAHHAQNAAMAVAVAHGAFGIELDVIAAELAAAAPARWRMELIETDDGVTVLNDAYNANPTSMEAALLALTSFGVGPDRRRIAVLGDMRELGSHHDAAHDAVGARAAELGVNLVVGVGDGGARIANAASDAGATVLLVPDADAASDVLTIAVQPGDAVLVKGSRALGLERVADALVAAGREGGAA